MRQHEGRSIQSVQRAINIINYISSCREKVSLHDISNALDLNINTTRGLVQTLQANGYLSRDLSSNLYFLGHEFFNKSDQLYKSHVQSIRNAAISDMEKIAKEFNISIWLQVCFNINIFTIEVVEAPNSFYTYRPATGRSLPLYASASGKLQLAYLPKKKQQQLIENLEFLPFCENTIVSADALKQNLKIILKNGYATENEELDIGISSIAAPFFDFQGYLAGTLSIVSNTMVVQKISKNLIPALISCSNKVTDSLFY